MHSKKIMHRDIKGGNILLNDQGIVKLADFGLSRDMIPAEKGPQYTTRVVTRYFRAPELALGDPHYDETIDVWSVGCTFAEIIAKKPLFPSKSDTEHFPFILR
jgi:serine/threonine protein kinase